MALKNGHFDAILRPSIQITAISWRDGAKHKEKPLTTKNI
jgi:hypothetical protein